METHQQEMSNKVLILNIKCPKLTKLLKSLKNYCKYSHAFMEAMNKISEKW